MKMYFTSIKSQMIYFVAHDGPHQGYNVIYHNVDADALTLLLEIYFKYFIDYWAVTPVTILHNLYTNHMFCTNYGYVED